MRRAFILSATLLLVLGAVQGAAPYDAVTTLNTSLNDGPYSDAKALAAVPGNTGVGIIERHGGWYHVRLASGQDGWIPMASLRFDSGATAAGGGAGDVAALFESGRSGASGTTATTGVRGLNTGDIQNAKPDPQAVTALNAWTAKPPEARDFAGKLPAQAQKVDYLPPPGGH